MMESIRRFIAPYVNEMRGIVRRAVVELVKESVKLQELQLSVMDGDVRDNVEYFQHFGFVSWPPKGTEAVVVAPGGKRSGSICIATGDRVYRLMLNAEGEVALYDDGGQSVLLKGNGEIHLTPGSRVVIAGDLYVAGNADIAGDVDITGGVTAGADISADGNVTAQGEVSDSNPTTPTLTAMRAAYNAHLGHAAVGGVTPGGHTTPSPM